MDVDLSWIQPVVFTKPFVAQKPHQTPQSQSYPEKDCNQNHLFGQVWYLPT